MSGGSANSERSRRLAALAISSGASRERPMNEAKFVYVIYISASPEKILERAAGCQIHA